MILRVFLCLWVLYVSRIPPSALVSIKSFQSIDNKLSHISMVSNLFLVSVSSFSVSISLHIGELATALPTRLEIC
ncbi:hypothetical protein DFJ43DRAFT_670195 [Lentinula guzmanii]|uniref:Secreted protein n=1 Tax=Lentinula guzmanii TaxID=2804957 RepID=A0AA38MWM0_9AGAR|nr:hypothetical protein DFJ43DRAFT_670195 [Lentinula guzmanii]